MALQGIIRGRGEPSRRWKKVVIVVEGVYSMEGTIVKGGPSGLTPKTQPNDQEKMLDHTTWPRILAEYVYCILLDVSEMPQ